MFIRALKQGVKLGVLQKHQGRFRLNGTPSELAFPTCKTKLFYSRNKQRLRPREHVLRIRSITPSTRSSLSD